MNPPKFDYYRAESVGEAISLMAQNPNAKFLAGGHSLIPVMNLRLADPGALIDIGRIGEMNGIHVLRDGSCSIGALTTHATVAANDDVPTVLSEAAGMIGDPQVRNRGTVGGNVAHADPASDLPTVFTALDASFEIEGPSGSRDVLAGDFFVDLFTTALQDGEILKSIRVRTPQPGRMFNNAAGSAYAKLANPASGYAMVGAAAVIAAENGRCTHCSVGVGGVMPTATRAASVAQSLQGKTLSEENIAAAAAAVADDLNGDVLTDIHASADYRRAMAKVYVGRALTSAARRAALT
ncbi:MAG: xanthine dehydrogenase family protein subunit M [Chloroflexota bacterium]|nr:MAG: xanthine dehydrogenase family protein subunit M [Chloroflexota bacterium]